MEESIKMDIQKSRLTETELTLIKPLNIFITPLKLLQSSLDIYEH